MKQPTFIKILTLVSFVFFMTLFLFYRVGKVDQYLNPAKASLKTPLGDSSSPLIHEKNDFSESAKDKSENDSLSLKRTEIMSSSKSTPVFETRSFPRLNLDSFIDASKKASIKTQ